MTMTPTAAAPIVRFDGDQLELVDEHGTQTISPTWLRRTLLGRQVDRSSAAWTDGRDSGGLVTGIGPERLAGAEVVDGHLVLRWRSGRHHAVRLDRLQAALAEGRDDVEPRTWGAGSHLRSHRYDDVLAQDATRLALLHDLAAERAVLVHHVPDDLAAGRDLVARIATPCATHTGSSFTLRASSSPTHLGETYGEILPHTDMAYRQQPPSLQVLHGLVAAEDGGDTVLVDGEALLGRLSDRAVRRLSATPVTFAATSDEVSLRGRHRILSVEGTALQQVVFNDRKLLVDPDADDGLWFALDAFVAALEDPTLRLQLRLPAGSMLVFDNRRVLHGRTAFTDPRRHLEGWFGNLDDADSRRRVLLAQRG
jgi:gamma-butyrobetaine dioxygenase